MFFFNWNIENWTKIRLHNSVAFSVMWGYNLLCVCMCALYSDRTPKVAPETPLQISNGAVLKLPSAQSRCGFQAFPHAEKLQLIYTLPVLALLFHALNSFSVLPAELIFSRAKYLKFLSGHKVLHPAKDFYSRSLGVGQPVKEGGTR